MPVPAAWKLLTHRRFDLLSYLLSLRVCFSISAFALIEASGRLILNIRLDNFSVILILVKVFAISNSTCSSVGTHFYAAREINQSSLRVAIEFDGGFARVILLAELTNTLDIAFVDILLVDVKALEVVTVGKEICTANIEVFDPSGHTALRQEKNGKRRTKTTKRWIKC